MWLHLAAAPVAVVAVVVHAVLQSVEPGLVAELPALPPLKWRRQPLGAHLRRQPRLERVQGAGLVVLLLLVAGAAVGGCVRLAAAVAVESVLQAGW